MNNDDIEFNTGDVVKLKSYYDYPQNCNMHEDWIGKEFIVINQRTIFLLLELNGESIGHWATKRFEHVHPKKLSAENLEEYEGLFE